MSMLRPVPGKFVADVAPVGDFREAEPGHTCRFVRSAENCPIAAPHPGTMTPHRLRVIARPSAGGVTTGLTAKVRAIATAIGSSPTGLK